MSVSTDRAGIINLAMVEARLRASSEVLGREAGAATASRARLEASELEFLLQGYCQIDHLVSSGTDLFQLGQSQRILELNHTLLFGADRNQREKHFASALRASERHFYDQAEGGGVRDLVEHYQKHARCSPWDRAARLHVRILARPQLFIEGNHRTAALLASYVLMRDGLPPFVLAPDITRSYFEPADAMATLGNGSLAMHFRGWRLRQALALMFRNNIDKGLLLSHSPQQSREPGHS